MAFEKFLKAFEVYNDSECTHTCLAHRKKYYINVADQDEFFQLYSAAVDKGTNLSLTEKHRDIGPILIDFDFRQNTSTRLYTQDHVQQIISLVMGWLDQHLYLESHTEVFVLEKPPRPYRSAFKDGIHIIIPSVVTEPHYQYQMRTDIIGHIEKILSGCGFQNNIQDIYDAAAVRNNWFLYGSKKPDETVPWEVTHLYTWWSTTDEDPPIIEKPCNYTINELIELFSIRNKFEKNVEQITLVKPAPAPPPAPTPSTSEAAPTDIYVESLVKILDPRRADNYNDWIALGFCLHNISSESNLSIWIDFSKQSPKYKPGECERLWHSMKSDGLKLGTLCFWAKSDNPFEYQTIVSNNIFSDIKSCNGGHYSVAKIAYSILKNKFVCVNAEGRSWYYFTGVFWKEDAGELQLRKELSTTVRQHYLQAMTKIASSQTIDEMQSGASTTTAKKEAENLLKTAFKLYDANFHESIIKMMRIFFYNESFLETLDGDPNLIGFNNGVWCLKEAIFRQTTPDDMISFSVGYDYSNTTDPNLRQAVLKYFEMLHPNSNQRAYVLKALARQLYGDSGCELFHVHSGYNASAGNGKSSYFALLELCLGAYIRKFPVEILISKQRGEAHKPMPEFSNWRGTRIMYCTEPSSEDRINSGVMKELTGGDPIQYRMLYSNKIHTFKPMFKISIMCNDAPQIEGNDEGIKRRIRKIDYISKFVDATEVDAARHMYEKDPNFLEEFKRNESLKMEFVRYILEHYDHNYKFEMPDVIRESSRQYLEDNNSVLGFVREFIKRDPDGFFLLKDAKEVFRHSQHFNGKIGNLKSELQKVLKVMCFEQKRIGERVFTSVFMGYKIVSATEYQLDDELNV